ncbi:MAG TPA: isochorismatase family protein [Sphingomonas sp.]|uniref:isochorismatase family protein n=1 Tax=Sphingomonas sp. TaxID=28214 RepID=UPI002C826F4B|nr:isochorismatase family protein [Sphingomonas sp.]HMI19674.1 isochorismatase family protein [Sphingomonas sp.]
MAVTTLDPNTALIVIDLQKGIVAHQTAPYPAADIVAKAASLLKAFRAHKLPVVLVHVVGGAPGRNEQPKMPDPAPDWAEFVPELDRQPGDHIVAKKTWGAFAHTGLEEHLRAQGVTQVVVAGVATAIGVESTARQAYEAGFNVALAIDAMTDLRAETHENSVARIFPRLGETGTADEIISLLDLR